MDLSSAHNDLGVCNVTPNNSHLTFLLSEFLQVRTESFGRGVVEQERDSE